MATHCADMKIPIINRKGGVAKSTTTINLGAALAQAAELGIASHDFRTLIVDMDPQASTTQALTRGREDTAVNLGDVLLRARHIEDAILATTTPNLHLIAAFEALGDEAELARLALRSAGGPEALVSALRTGLRDAIAMLDTPFDFILFDCPPAIGLPMAMAMTAGERFIIPTKVERFSLHGTSRLFRFMEQLVALREATAEPTAQILGLLLTDLNYQFHDANEREAEFRATYGDAVFDTVIRRNVTIERAQDAYRTIFQEDPQLKSTGAQGYRDLAAEVLLRAAAFGDVDCRHLSDELRLRAARLGLQVGRESAEVLVA
jgi:chromosome partitioning protein